MSASLVNPSVVFVDTQRKISEVVAIMIEKEISSVLVVGAGDIVEGIITERDILRKFTLLDSADKLSRKVNTIMTRGVKFVSLDRLEEEILELHSKFRIRHFPVLKGDKPLASEIVGIVSTSDLLKKYIQKHHSSEVDTSEPDKPKLQEVKKNVIGVFSHGNRVTALQDYQKIFESLGFDTIVFANLNQFYSQNRNNLPPILFDIDHFDVAEMRDVIRDIKAYPRQVLIATGNSAFVAPFRKALNSERHSVALKPLDFSFCAWFFENRE